MIVTVFWVDLIWIVCFRTMSCWISLYNPLHLHSCTALLLPQLEHTPGGR